MTAITDIDPATDILLDFIAGGETGGNYNAYFGHAKSRVDLGGHTLASIYEFQRGMLANDPRSTAIGRYQFLRKTLQELQAECSLPDTELFTPALQDRLGLRLLVRRGYSDWRLGAITDSEFAHRLSLEWASLPDPKADGRSHYDGDSAGNHASTSLSEVYAMLARSRAMTGAATPTGSAVVDTPAPADPNTDISPIPRNADLMIAWAKTGQLYLRDAGYYDGPIDGIWGTGSHDAVARFQRDCRR